jgi:PPOX class probable F420-dependent enzyme
MNMLSEAQAALFLDTNLGVLSTLRPDGSAHATPLWVDWDGESVVVNTALGRFKERHMRRDPRVSVVVIDRNNPQRYVSVDGEATLETEGAEDHIDKMAKKYLGLDKYPDAARSPGEQRVMARIRVTRVTHLNAA